MREEEFVKGLFSEYYRSFELSVPFIAKREWGFGEWGRKIAVRHFAFHTGEELRSYLVRNTPLYVSHSVALYELPDARPMERKCWQGAELVFDIDADPGYYGCEHGSGWVCEGCLGHVKEETVRLIEDFLMPDFGLKKDELTVNFSGSRGYHVHVMNEDVLPLEGDARKELIDYIIGNGFDVETLFGPEEGGNKRDVFGPKPDDGGWGGKFAKYYVKNKAAKLSPAKMAKVVDEIGKGIWSEVQKMEKNPNWKKKIVAEMLMRLKDRIDANVTADVKKLIRLPESLHGDTGLKAMHVKRMDEFDPMKHAIVFRKGSVKVRTSKVNKFEMLEQTFGPFENETIELPLYAGVYLLCRNLATLSREGGQEEPQTGGKP